MRNSSKNTPPTIAKVMPSNISNNIASNRLNSATANVVNVAANKVINNAAPSLERTQFMPSQPLKSKTVHIARNTPVNKPINRLENLTDKRKKVLEWESIYN